MIFYTFFLYQDQVAKFKRNPPPSPNIQFHGFLKIYRYIIRHYQTSFDRIRKDTCTNIVDKIRNRILNLHSKKNENIKGLKCITAIQYFR